jgi:AraC-like DNA-binding protein
MPVGGARRLDFLDSACSVVPSAELERVTSLTRYELARQFRAVYGTSPYRYSLLRRLDFARGGLRRGEHLVDLAVAAGFADQAHFTRMFASTYGMTPGRYRAVHAREAFRCGIRLSNASAMEESTGQPSE